jgi:8-oxo-dGTP pyrophosphatase MutT (NUDIX family)
MDCSRRVTDYERALFRVELQAVEGRPDPYVFVRRIGAVTVLPVIRDSSGELQVLTIDNDRRYYGMAERGLPGGNIEGGHDHPESVVDAALRELCEEIGFGYPDPGARDVDVFALRPVSSSVEYPRFLVVARHVEHLDGADTDGDERITLCPTPLAGYVDELLRLRNGRIYPEVNSAIAKAGMECGADAVLAWLSGEPSVPNAAIVPCSFEPWLTTVHASGVEREAS